MAVKVISRVSSNPLQSTVDTPNLVGNVGDYLTTEIEVEVQTAWNSGGFDQVFVNNDNTLFLLTGNWIDYGFAVGDTIGGTIEVTTLPSTVVTYTATSVVVTAISGGLLTYSGAFERSGAVDILTDFPTFFTIPSSNTTHSFNFAKLHVVKDYTSVEFTYNEILNSLYLSPTLNSLLDGSQTKLTATGLDSTDTAPINMTLVNPKSGASVISATIEGEGTDPSTNEGKNVYILRLTHIIGGIYQTPLTKPSWYNGTECLTDTYQFAFNSGLVQQVSSLEDTNVQVQGNTGWFDEKFNGGANALSISNVVYKTATDTIIDSVNSDAPTKIQFRINGSGFDATDTKFNWGFIVTPNDRTAYANNNYQDIANLFGNTMGVAQVYSHSATPTVGTIAGFTAPNGGVINVTSYKFEVGSSTVVDVEIIISPDSLATTYINSFAVGDKTFGWWASVVVDNTVTTPDRVNLLTTDQFLEIEVVIEPIKTDSLAKIYPHNKDYYTDPTTANDNNLVVEDDAHAAIRFTQQTNDVITQVTMGIELYVIANGNSVYTLDSTTINTSTSPISLDGTQEINSITNRPFITYADGDKNKQITLRRLTSLDSGANRGYEFIYPFRMRWEWWLANGTLPTAFYDNTEPLDNLNNEWYTKLISGIGVRYFLETIQNGLTTKNTINLDLVSYNNDVRVSPRIRIYDDALYTNSLLIGTKTNKYTGDEFELIDGQLNYLVARLTSPNTWASYDYGEVTIEVEDNSGFTTQWKIRTDEDPTPNNPLRPISGETRLLADITTDTQYFYLICAIDPTKLQISATNFKITAEWIGDVGTPVGSEPDTYTYFQERDIAWAEIVQPEPEPEPDEFCEPNECSYEIMAIADASSTDRYKNDVHLHYDKAQTRLGTVTFYLVEEDGTEHIIDDGTYGLFYAKGDITYLPSVSVIQIHWRNVLILLGEGCYRIKTVITKLVGEPIVKYTCCYKLQQYSCELVQKTVRITSVQNGNFQDLGINFKGTDFTGDIRFEATFGKEQIEVESTMYVGTNDVKKLNRQDQRSTFTLESKLLPHICITHPLIKYHLRGTELYITVYDKYNHRQDYITYPVFFESVEEFKYFDYNTNAKLTLLFSERIIETRTNTCDGNRPNAPFSGGYVPTCVGGDGSGDVEVNGVNVGTYTAPTTFELDVINSLNAPIGSYLGGNDWLILDLTYYINGLLFDSIPATSGGSLLINVHDQTGADIGSKVGSDWVVNIPTCEDATVTVNGEEFGSVVSGGTLNVPVYDRAFGGFLVGVLGIGRWVIGLSTININSTLYDSLNAEGTLNINVHDQTGADIGSLVGSDWVVINPIRGNFQANRGVLDTFVVDASSAGVYTGTTNDGGSGTVTILVNSVAISFPQTLVIGDLIDVSRSTTTNIGWYQLNG